MTLTREAFDTLTERVFTAAFDDGTVDFTLVETAAAGGVVDPSARAPFSLIFTSPWSLVQSTYLLTNAELGEQAIFLVPIGRDGADTRYEAVFN